MNQVMYLMSKRLKAVFPWRRPNSRLWSIKKAMEIY